MEALKKSGKRSEDDHIVPAFIEAMQTIHDLVEEMGSLTQAAADGKLATRGNVDRFQNGYRDIVQGVNNTLDALIAPLNVSAEYIDRISKGDIPAKITDTYRGDFNEIKNNVNQLIESTNQMVAAAEHIAAGDASIQIHVRSDSDALAKGMLRASETLRELTAEITGLTNAAVQGKLAIRGNAGKFRGGVPGNH